ncbi:DUF1214 domain-containing protein [Bdellovibrio sp. ArHS]|uniref:DUF1214 domain-containing protein n=1 Tax=Bdellovibrio sp. ArHS TaxID=1569284 RepID=UPI000AA64277|nr:DUF1214 domain-containing protein [Bdellovibrio sp. ArHS]
MEGLRKQGVQEGVNIFSAMPDAPLTKLTTDPNLPFVAAVVDLLQSAYAVEVPAGAFLGFINDHHQRWIMDLGLMGKDAGNGGKYVIIPSEYKEPIPPGSYVGKSATRKVLILVQAVPQPGQSLHAAQDSLEEIRIYPLTYSEPSKALTLVRYKGKKADMTAVKWEDNLQYWQKLAQVIQDESLPQKDQEMYDQLKTFGIQKNQIFKPNESAKIFLAAAAKEGKKQLLKTAFTSDRPDRVNWGDRRWEWVLLSTDPSWALEPEKDPGARDRYFVQSLGISAAQMKRDSGVGTLTWGAYTDGSGRAFDGSKSYKLSIPLPVPTEFFWSVSLYDSDTRSFLQNGTKKSSLRSLEELKETKGLKSIDVYFSPKAPLGKQKVWIKTIPGKKWFAYFRIFSPGKAAIEGPWKLGDILEMKSETIAKKSGRH